MQSCNRAIVFVFMLLSACADADAAIERDVIIVQNIGLRADVAVPPKGVGVAPIDGHPGVVAASYPLSSIGTNGPGSLALYGGQWVLPLPVAPGAKLLNASCDFLTTAGVVTTMELVGRNGTITSKVVGPAGNVRATVWLLPTDADPNGYTVEDGGTVGIVLSFRDTSGAWTTGAAQQPVLGCAVNAMPTAVRTLTVPIMPPTLAVTGFHCVQIGGPSQTALVIPLALTPGATIQAARVRVRDAGGGITVDGHILRTADGIQTYLPVAESAPTSGLNQEETITINGGVVTAPASQYYLAVSHHNGGVTAISDVCRAELDVSP